MVKSDTQKQWIEQELERSLRRVAAPEELWDRVQHPGQEPAPVRTRFMAWATLPVVMLVALWAPHARNTGPLQFHSSDPAEIRAWVKTNTSLDVPLHAGNLAGANAVSAQMAEIAYRVDGRKVSLLVSNDMLAAGPVFRERNARRVSWTAGGKTYLLACAEPQDLKACALCHVGG
jgi:hypothetical protein